MAEDPDWEAFREELVVEETFFHGNMRLYAVRLTHLLISPDEIDRLYRLYSGNKTALTIKQIAPFAPKYCGLFPDPHERFKDPEEDPDNSILFFAQQVPGSRLKDIAKSSNGYLTVKSVILKLWEALPTIHEFWGFSGGIDKEGVFFDSASGKITILNWDRCQLPITHFPGHKDGRL